MLPGLPKKGGLPMHYVKVALLWTIVAILPSPAWSQSPPFYLQPGTYNAPAGAGAYSPTVPLRTPYGPVYMPGQPFGQASIFPQNLLNRDILIPNQAIWYQQLQRSARQTGRQVREDKVVISVKMPEGDAQLWVNDQPTKQKGLERVFVTPPLEPGTYKYQLRASWVANKTPVRVARTVTFQPGDDLVIDFAKKP
jgi:uncharacterized protein (TIGR03000 family)